MSGIAQRGLKPAALLAESRPHGDRLRYVGGCRCDQCRRANSEYESARQKARRAGDWNGIVDAGKARAHLLKLSTLGVGRRAVADCTDIAETILSEIRAGKRARIRARTERGILAVTKAMALDGALTRAKETWKLIDELVEEGYTIAYLAEQLGYKNPTLQFGRDRVTVRNAYRVECLHRKLTS